MYDTRNYSFLVILFFFAGILFFNGCHKGSRGTELNGGRLILEIQRGKFQVERGGGYGGSSECRECHYRQYKSWEKTGHARSYRTLSNIGKDGEKRCLRCHTTGFGKESGFENITESADLGSVGCESCHGPALEHLEARPEDKGVTIYWLSKGCVRCESVKYCIGCHNLVQDPGFDIALELKRIKH